MRTDHGTYTFSSAGDTLGSWMKQRVTQHFRIFALPNNFLQADAQAKQSGFPARWSCTAEDHR